MTSGGLGRGAGVLRSAPWLPLLGGSAAAAPLLGVAVLVHGSGFAPFAALLGLAACGGAAAYVLDEESAAVLDATPTSRGRRVAWRLLLVAVPGLVALAGLLGLDHLDGATHWLPFAAASLAMGVGLAAGLRRDAAAPGDLAGVLTVSVVVLLVAADPLRRWVPVLPLGDSGGAGRSALMWAGVVAGCAAVVVRCARDPAARRRDSLQRTGRSGTAGAA